MTGPLLYEIRDAIALITLNRPERHNALTPEMICRLAEAFDRFEADPALRVAVVTGAGQKSFCSGGDLERTLPLLSGARAPEDAWDQRLVDSHDALFRSNFKGPPARKPLIAALNGHCLAGGFELMLATDIRVASESARFGLPEVQHALIPFAGALVRLPQQLPQALAMEMLLTGDPVTAERMAALGLINHVVEADAVLDKALAIADRIARNGPLAIAEIKRVTDFARGRPQVEGFAAETEAMARVMASQDAREGPAAFMQKRPPRYRGL
ncbi:MAG: crotonase/enoyl-CoA hydratase family protein [Rhodobacteraceae bacterium]|nr:MAG: crotonase/enoyl-CoA hydratase family protein [Paracoccaceae bacterium]